MIASLTEEAEAIGWYGQRLDLERDLFGRVLRPIGILREHDGDRLADIAHARPRQQRLPIGNERLDAIGGWRTTDESGKPVDASGRMINGQAIEGLSGLRAALLEQPDQFPSTLTEKLMAYALGRRLEYYDRPAVRQIVHGAAAGDYRWSALVMGIVKSPTFLMRGAPAATN